MCLTGQTDGQTHTTSTRSGDWSTSLSIHGQRGRNVRWPRPYCLPVSHSEYVPNRTDRRTDAHHKYMKRRLVDKFIDPRTAGSKRTLATSVLPPGEPLSDGTDGRTDGRTPQVQEAAVDERERERERKRRRDGNRKWVGRSSRGV